LTESQENLDESHVDASNSNMDHLGLNKHRKSKSSDKGSGTSLLKWNFKLRERLFLFAFDLIEMNSFYNNLVYCLFIVIDFVFIAYYPLN
jgi:hypothetical protein